MEIGVAGPIITQKTTSKTLWDKDTHTPQYETKILWQLILFMEIQPFTTML